MNSSTPDSPVRTVPEVAAHRVRDLVLDLDSLASAARFEAALVSSGELRA